MNDTIIFMDSETEEEICQYIGKGFIIPNEGEYVFIEKDDENVEGVVTERLFTYQGDWVHNRVVVTIWVNVSKEESNDSSM